MSLAILFNLGVRAGLRPSEYLDCNGRTLALRRMLSLISVLSLGTMTGLGTSASPKPAKAEEYITLFAALVHAKITQAETSRREIEGCPQVSQLRVVFCGKEGNSLRPRNAIAHLFKPILKRAGLPDSVRLYDLRHLRDSAVDC